MPADKPRETLIKIFHAGLERVKGRPAVRAYLQDAPLQPPQVHLVAIGKAASSMTLGAMDAAGASVADGLVITKHGHLDPELDAFDRISCFESDHPVPGRASIEAGQMLLEYMTRNAMPGGQFLFLLSGGASSLVEVPVDGCTLEDLQRLNQMLLAHGLDIQQVNKIRRAVSKIKGGRLAARLNGAKALVLLISDVPGDDPGVIGSGLLTPVNETVDYAAYNGEIVQMLEHMQAVPVPESGVFAGVHTAIVARLDDARQACMDEARSAGCSARIADEFIAGDALSAACDIVQKVLSGTEQVLIFGGETHLTLPPAPGAGGRNQHLALAAALYLQGIDGVYLLSAGTDGTDGPTEAAGGLVDGATLARGGAAGLDARDSLNAADSHHFLQATGDLIVTGPTGTNVMDLIIGLKTA